MHIAAHSLWFRRAITWLAALLLFGLAPIGASRDASRENAGELAATALSQEARATLALIKRGGPYPYRQDGSVFGNRERLLPAQPRGYYREYTVRMPGSRDRGARRIIAGGNPPALFYYTDDHYRSFRLVTSP